MNARNFVSEANLAEHYGDCGFHLVEDEETNETEEIQLGADEEKNDDVGLMISEPREPFEPESHELKYESPVEGYLERMKERVEGKQPKVAMVDKWSEGYS